MWKVSGSHGAVGLVGTERSWTLGTIRAASVLSSDGSRVSREYVVTSGGHGYGGQGERSATGRPRSVISIVSPFSTKRSNSLARGRDSRTPT